MTIIITKLIIGLGFINMLRTVGIHIHLLEEHYIRISLRNYTGNPLQVAPDLFLRICIDITSAVHKEVVFGIQCTIPGIKGQDRNRFANLCRLCALTFDFNRFRIFGLILS